MAFPRLRTASTSEADILHLSQHFCTQIWAGQRIFVSSLLPETRLEVTESTAERKHKDTTLEFLISEGENLNNHSS